MNKISARCRVLAVYGVWQAEGKVQHLIASKLVDRSELLGALPTTSREFCQGDAIEGERFANPTRKPCGEGRFLKNVLERPFCFDIRADGAPRRCILLRSAAENAELVDGLELQRVEALRKVC